MVLEGPPRRQERGVGGDAPRAVAQESPDGHAERLGLDVPQGGVDRPEGTDEGPAPAGHLRTAVEPLPDWLWLHRTGAGGASPLRRPRPVPRWVPPGRIHSSGDPGIGIGLAEGDGALMDPAPPESDRLAARSRPPGRSRGARRMCSSRPGDLHVSRQVGDVLIGHVNLGFRRLAAGSPAVGARCHRRGSGRPPCHRARPVRIDPDDTRCRCRSRPDAGRCRPRAAGPPS